MPSHVDKPHKDGLSDERIFGVVKVADGRQPGPARCYIHC